MFLWNAALATGNFICSQIDLSRQRVAKSSQDPGWGPEAQDTGRPESGLSGCLERSRPVHRDSLLRTLH